MAWLRRRRSKIERLSRIQTFLEILGVACPALVFVPVPVPEEKTVKNRVHLDLAPDDQLAEVERLRALGARHIGIGQGNEFCILTPRDE